MQNPLKLFTATFDDITSENSISKLHNSVTEVVPSKFNELKSCGLLNNLLTQIVTAVDSLNNNMKSFQASVDAHKENIVDSEYKSVESISLLPDINLISSVTPTSEK